MIRTEKAIHGQCIVLAADSVADAAEAWKGTETYKGRRWQFKTTWTGESYAETEKYCRTGREHLVPAAEALISRLETGGISFDWPQWCDDVAGAFPNVPAALAGVPMTMRAKRPSESEKAPIKVFIDLTTSGGISHTAIAKRGEATLALAMVLSAQRPVDLRVVVGLGAKAKYPGAWLTVPIPAAPIDLSVACYALTSAGFARSVGYDILMQDHAEGYWPHNLEPFGDESSKFIKCARRDLDIGPRDLYIPPAHSDDEQVCARPVEWINRQLANFRKMLDKGETEA